VFARSEETSTNRRAHTAWRARDYALGALAVFGVAKALPRLARQSPWLQENLAKGLDWMASRATLENTNAFFYGMRNYAEKSRIWGNRPKGGNLPPPTWNSEVRIFQDTMAKQRENFRKNVQEGKFRSSTGDNFDMMDFASHYLNVRRGADQISTRPETRNALNKAYFDHAIPHMQRRIDQSSIKNLTGHRHLTVGEALNDPTMLTQKAKDTFDTFKGEFKHYQKSVLGRSDAEVNAAMQGLDAMAFDPRVMVNAQGKKVDFRGMHRAYQESLDVLGGTKYKGASKQGGYDWSIPFVNINPFKVMGISQWNSWASQKVGGIYKYNSFAPLLYNRARGGDYNSSGGFFRIGNRLIEIERQTGKVNYEDGWGQIKPGSMFGGFLRMMKNQPLQEFTPKQGFPNEIARAAKALDFGRQEQMPEVFRWTTMDTWLNRGLQKIFNGASPWKRVHGEEALERLHPRWASDPANAAGSESLGEFGVLLRQTKVDPIAMLTLDKNAWRQFYSEISASVRHTPENVTTTTMFGYASAHKINVAMTQIGLGFSVDGGAMDSTTSFFKSLLTKRVMPLIGIFYGWQGLNAMGPDGPSGVVTGGLERWQDIIAGGTDMIGLSDRLDRIGELMPGVDQLRDFPLLPLPNERGEVSVLTLGDLLPVHESLDDLEFNRTMGITPIRRGRFWSLGATPFTGADVIGYAPHFSRMVGQELDMSYGPSARSTPGLLPFTDVPVAGSFLAAFGIATPDGSPGTMLAPGMGGSMYARTGPMGSINLYSDAIRRGDGATLEGRSVAGFGGELGVDLTEAGGNTAGLERIRDMGGFAAPVLGSSMMNNVSSTMIDRTMDLLGFTGYALKTGTGLEKMNIGLSPLQIGGISNTLWQSQLGGFGGTISEVLRRFFPIVKVEQDADRTPSGMPSWMPGDSGFTNFQRGLPYEKIAMGRYVLPGPKFAALWGMTPPDLSIEAGALGDREALHDWWTYRSALRHGVEAAPTKNVKQQLEEAGFEIKQGGRVVDEAHQIFTDVPFFLQDGARQIPIIIGTPNEPAWGPSLRRAQFAASQMGVDQSLLVMPGFDGSIQTTNVRPDFDFLGAAAAQLQEQRAGLPEAMRDGRVNGMEYYHPTYRMLSLAMSAPHTPEYTNVSRQAAKMKLTAEQKRVMEYAREIAKENKTPLRTYGYKFLHQQTQTISGEVEAVLDKDTVMIEGIANPIRLAGVRVNPDEPGTEGAPEEYLRSILRPGTNVRVQIGEPDAYQLGNTEKSLRGMISAGGRSISQQMVEGGHAQYDSEDESVPGRLVRYTPEERAFGALWERFAHFTTPIHTKLLNVKSATERYIDKEIYGQSFQSWAHPFKDFVIPTMQSFAYRLPFGAPILGGVLGAAFGRSPFGRMLFTGIGAAAGLLAAAPQMAARLGGGWHIPGRRQEQRELEEYVDALKYVKSWRNFAYFAERAKAEENFDVNDYLSELDRKRYENKESKKMLLAKKRVAQGIPDDGMAQAVADQLKLPGMFQTRKEVQALINGYLKSEVTDDRTITDVGPVTAQALYWYRKTKQTMQGWQLGDSVEDLIASLPNTDRRYFTELMEAPERERRHLMEVAPRYLRRAMKMARGEKLNDRDESPSLAEVFREHGLPDPGWEGWRPEVSLGDVRVLMIRREGMDMHGMGIYPQEIEKADQSAVRNIPKFSDYKRRPSASDTESRLRNILSSAGINHQIEVVMGGRNGLQIELDHEWDRKPEVKQMLAHVGGML